MTEPTSRPSRSAVEAAGTIQLGDRTVNRFGFGAMRLTGDAPFSPAPPRDEMIALLRHVVDCGVQLIDTADSYSLGLNEELIADALHPYPADVLVATKAGQSRPGGAWVALGRPEYLRQQAELSLMRLRVERIDLFQLHRIDPQVPFDEQMGALAQLVDEGKVAAVGLSQVSVDEIERARRLVEVVSVQNKYSFSDRADDDVVDHCEATGIAFLPWRPLEVAPGDEARLAAEAPAGERPAAQALAWLLARSPVMAPIPGTANRDHFDENLTAVG